MSNRLSYLDALKSLEKLAKKYGSDIYFGSDLVCMEIRRNIEDPNATVSKITVKRLLEMLYENNKVDRIKVMTDWRRNRTSERYKLRKRQK